MSTTEKIQEGRKAIKRMLNTEDGKIATETLKELYVDSSALWGTLPEHTFYRLGQKEVVQDILQIATMDIDAIEIKGELNE